VIYETESDVERAAPNGHRSALSYNPGEDYSWDGVVHGGGRGPGRSRLAGVRVLAKIFFPGKFF